MPDSDKQIQPRQVADKSSQDSLKKAITMALEIESEAVRENTQTFNQNHYSAIGEIEDYQDLKDRARTMKEDEIKHITEL